MTFDKSGVVRLGCNVHDWMVAYIYVVDTPYFAKSGKDGKLRLDGLPAGEYELRVWHPDQRSAVAPQRFALSAANDKPLAFKLEVNVRKPRYKPPLDPSAYQ